MQDLREESLSEILETLGIELTKEQISAIAKDFAFSIDMEREMAMTPHIRSSHVETCPKCKSLQAQLNDKEKEVQCYQDSVKRRRNASSVWIGNDGDVRYER